MSTQTNEDKVPKAVAAEAVCDKKRMHELLKSHLAKYNEVKSDQEWSEDDEMQFESEFDEPEAKQPVMAEPEAKQPVMAELKAKQPVMAELKAIYMYVLMAELKAKQPVMAELKAKQPVMAELKAKQSVMAELKAEQPVMADELKAEAKQSVMADELKAELKAKRAVMNLRYKEREANCIKVSEAEEMRRKLTNDRLYWGTRKPIVVTKKIVVTKPEERTLEDRMAEVAALKESSRIGAERIAMLREKLAELNASKPGVFEEPPVLTPV